MNRGIIKLGIIKAELDRKSRIKIMANVETIAATSHDLFIFHQQSRVFSEVQCSYLLTVTGL
jgi:hypothetical protein